MAFIFLTKGYKVFILCLFLALSINVLGQSIDKKVYSADKYFKIRNYEAALTLYLEVLEKGVEDPIILYRTALCYEKADEIDEQVKSIPYFERAIKTGMDELPASVYFDLGSAYHKNEQIEKALEYYGKFKSTIKNDPQMVQKAEKALQEATNALALMGNPRSVEIFSQGPVINSEYTEYNPIVSADESVLAFTALRPNTGRTRSSEKFIEDVYIAYNISGAWSQPEKIEIVSNYNVGTAGLSVDGQRMLVFIGGAEGTGNLYSIDKSGKEWSKPVTLGNQINSRNLETTASLTPDGKTIYFASNRPGGYGGLDLYKSEKLESGEWGEPVNLGGEVNSKYDEDAPFIHPDQWTLFFTSDGHNTMGGRDIFVTRLFNGAWTTPENMGYPINTTANDDYFTLTADGRRAYFSSDRKGGKGGQDIYSLNMPEEEANIPLTMVKGQILNGEDNKPLHTKIYVIDLESGKKLDFVYQPDPKTGNYLIILPPAKNYDMIIESEGFLPYTLNINVPGQTYFYELYQRIYLKTIKQFDVVVGQSVEVKNAFYDTHEDAVTDIRETHEAALVQSDSIDIYDLMNDLIAANDQKGIDYLTSLIYRTNPIDDVSFIEIGSLEEATRVYYYDESDESKFEKKEVDGRTIFSLPTMFVTEEAARQKNKAPTPKVDMTLLQEEVKIYFEAGKSDLKLTYYNKLDALLEKLKTNDQLGVQISGYASSEGSEDSNRNLSNRRAISVLDYINQKGIVRRRIIARGYGATKDEKSSAEESRRVEIKLVDLNDQKLTLK
ncbi:OmpA family protein [Fulvivirga sp. M361]|uniref:OmpA family protein n=1 Tax=Fulvivirga sp. M361 TaxID=2594266 RepID=UPI00117A0800|nr:OmpA family protein [Fulvivirga sp. M361]TRX52630.1 OmpA family protein [Fulvivirga sp. M361]